MYILGQPRLTLELELDSWEGPSCPQFKINVDYGFYIPLENVLGETSVHETCKIDNSNISELIFNSSKQHNILDCK